MLSLTTGGWEKNRHVKENTGHRMNKHKNRRKWACRRAKRAGGGLARGAAFQDSIEASREIAEMGCGTVWGGAVSSRPLYKLVSSFSSWAFSTFSERPKIHRKGSWGISASQRFTRAMGGCLCHTQQHLMGTWAAIRVLWRYANTLTLSNLCPFSSILMASDLEHTDFFFSSESK